MPIDKINEKLSEGEIEKSIENEDKEIEIEEQHAKSLSP